jgi:pilus assembly protein CpaB
MMTRRILTIVVAVLLAALGAVGVLDYVHQADNRALAGMRAVTAYVATAQIPAGQSAGAAVQNRTLVAQQFPASSVPADAVRSITPSVSGLVLSSGLAPGQMLLSPMLGTSTQTAQALPIPPGYVAVTMQFCVQQAVANYVTPGSYVAIYNTSVNNEPVTGACSGIPAPASGMPPTVALKVPKVLVLAVGEGTATPPSTGTAAGGSAASSAPSGGATIYLTMAVLQNEVPQLIGLGESGSPYLALLTPAEATSTDTAFQP